MDDCSIGKSLTLSSHNVESVESVRGYGLLRHAAFLRSQSTPPFIGGVESVRAWRGTTSEDANSLSPPTRDKE